MTTFTSQIEREFAMHLGREAVRIGEQGFYIAPSGKRVEIKQDLQAAVEGTKSYPPDSELPEHSPGEHQTVISVTNETTLSAARRLFAGGLDTAVLNLASASSQGGGFLEGSRAQEEYLARSSGLYECLRKNPMYGYYREGLGPLYTDRLTSFFMIYSPNVPVFRGDDHVLLEKPETVSIITAAAVNARKVPESRKQEIAGEMCKRILKVLAAGVVHGHNAIVLGAWGCGAFGLDGTEIAGMFRQALEDNFRGAYREVVFAIVDWSPEKKFIGPFEQAFK